MLYEDGAVKIGLYIAVGTRFEFWFIAHFMI